MDLPITWVWAKLGRLGKLLGGGTPSKNNPSYWNGRVPWISPKDMKSDRIADSIDHISQLGVKNSSVREIPPGSILFVVRGMILNHTLPTAITNQTVTVNQDMKALVPEIPDMSEYLAVACRYVAPALLFEVKEATHGTRRLETRILRNWALPIPPLEEQMQIVERVSRLLLWADEVESHYKRAKFRLDKLPATTLAKAFRGELVQTEGRIGKELSKGYAKRRTAID